MTKHSLRSTGEVIQSVEVKQFFVFNLQKKIKFEHPDIHLSHLEGGSFFYRLYFTDIRAIVRFEIKIFWDPHGGGQLGMDPTSKQIEILSNGRQRLRASSSDWLEPFFIISLCPNVKVVYEIINFSFDIWNWF